MEPVGGIPKEGINFKPVETPDESKPSAVSNDNVFKFIEKNQLNPSKISSKLKSNKEGKIELELFQKRVDAKNNLYKTNKQEDQDPNEELFLSAVIEWEIDLEGGGTKKHLQRVDLPAVTVPGLIKSQRMNAGEIAKTYLDAQRSALVLLKAREQFYKNAFEGRQQGDQSSQKVYETLKNSPLIAFASNQLSLKEKNVVVLDGDKNKVYNFALDQFNQQTTTLPKTTLVGNLGVYEQILKAQDKIDDIYEKVDSADQLLGELESKKLSPSDYAHFIERKQLQDQEQYGRVSTYFGKSDSPALWKRAIRGIYSKILEPIGIFSRIIHEKDSDIVPGFAKTVLKYTGVKYLFKGIDLGVTLLGAATEDVKTQTNDAKSLKKIFQAPEDGFLNRLNLAERHLLKNEFRGFDQAKNYYFKNVRKAIDEYDGSYPAKNKLLKAKNELDNFAALEYIAFSLSTSLPGTIQKDKEQVDVLLKDLFNKILAQVPAEELEEGLKQLEFSDDEIKKIQEKSYSDEVLDKLSQTGFIQGTLQQDEKFRYGGQLIQARGRFSHLSRRAQGMKAEEVQQKHDSFTDFFKKFGEEISELLSPKPSPDPEISEEKPHPDDE